MKPELNTEDKQRIEQEADNIHDNNCDAVLDSYYEVKKLMVKMAEYATIFEREQTVKQLKLCRCEHHQLAGSIVLCFACTGHESYVLIPEELYKQLEAERSELRAKVIDECIDSLHGLSAFGPKQVFRILNELKNAKT